MQICVSKRICVICVLFMKILKRDPLLENIHKGLLKAYAHIPAELEQEKKRKEALKDKK